MNCQYFNVNEGDNRMLKQLIAFVFGIGILSLFIIPINSKATETFEKFVDEAELTEMDDNIYNSKVNKTQSEASDAFIYNFDVSDSGKIIIALKNNTANIYDSEGCFEYCLNYSDISSGCITFWYNDNIIIYVFRGDTFIFLSEDGIIEKTCKFNGNESQLINTVTNTSVNEFDNYKYNAEKGNTLIKLLSFERNQLVQTNTNNGDTKIIFLYKGATGRVLKAWGVILLWIAAVVLFILYLKYEKKFKAFFRGLIT